MLSSFVRGRRIFLLAALGLTATPCASGGTDQTSARGTIHGSASAEIREDAPAIPLVDHHQHLLSTATRDTTLDFIKGWPLRPITPPREVTELLGARTAAWNNKAALSPLYTEDSVVVGSIPPSLKSGREDVAELVSEVFARPYRMLPVSYRVSADGGRVAGYYVRGDGDTIQYVGHFYLDLKRSPDGPWRIATETMAFPGPKIEPTVDAQQIVASLDEAGVRRAVILSVAYYFSRPQTEGAGEYDRVRAENDWTLAQVARFPDRLIAICSFSPIRDHALAELERCARTGRFKGIKLHFDASHVDLTDAEQTAKVRAVFAAANRARLPLIVHIRQGRDYGGRQTRIFLEQLLPAAPDVPVQVAHLSGGGAYSDEALAVLAEAVAGKDPRTRNLYFDLGQAQYTGTQPGHEEKIVARMRQIGMDRMLYGSDGPQWDGVTPKTSWKDLGEKLPLTRQELEIIAGNVAPYAR